MKDLKHCLQGILLIIIAYSIPFYFVPDKSPNRSKDDVSLGEQSQLQVQAMAKGKKLMPKAARKRPFVLKVEPLQDDENIPQQQVYELEAFGDYARERKVDHVDKASYMLASYIDNSRQFLENELNKGYEMQLVVLYDDLQDRTKEVLLKMINSLVKGEDEFPYHRKRGRAGKYYSPYGFGHKSTLGKVKHFIRQLDPRGFLASL